MPYTPENNPYVPGDPSSYDLKWMVQEVKAAQAVGVQAAASAEAAAASAEAAAASAEQSGDWEADARLYAQNAELSATNAAASAEEAAGVVAPITQALNTQGQQISVLEGRMDAFASLAEGSTTGDAELQDIRVAADGTVYPTAGDAVRGQITNLRNGIGNTITPQMITGRAIDNAGTVNVNSLTDASDFIPVYPNTQILMHKVDSGSLLGCVFYDKNKAFVSKYSDTTGITINIETTVPSDAYYLRVTARTGVIPYIEYQDIFNGYILPAKNLSTSLDEQIQIPKPEITIISSKYIAAADGTENDQATYDCTDFISVMPNTVIHVLNGVYGNIVGGAIYDINKVYLNKIDGVSGSHIDVKLEIPSNAYYIRYSVLHNGVPGVTYDLFNDYILPGYQNKKNFFGMQLFEKIGVIGDSISVGWAKDKNGNNSRRNTGISWVQQMARRLGATAYNLGASGVNPITWFDSAFDGAAYCYNQYLSATECDLYIIGLGLNGGTLGTTADINESDYTQNAATFYGQYARIIQMINNDHPNAIVMCLTEPTTRISEYDQAVRNICGLSYINAELVDLENNYFDLFNTSEILAEKQPDDIHFTPYGYSLIADAMVKALSDYISKNPAQFKYVGVTTI